MLVIVRKDYFDLQADKTLRKSGQLIEYKNEERANELLAKGFVRRVEIQVVEDPKEAEKAKEVEDPEEVKDTEEVEGTEEAEETKREVKKRPAKK